MVKFMGWSQGRNIRRWISRDARGLSAEFPGRTSSSEFVYARTREVKWGALAYGANGIHGRSWHKASKEEAEAGALKDCARLGRCEVTSVNSEGCAALAAHKEGTVAVETIGVDPNSLGARVIARRRCEAQSSGAPCRIVALVCADGRHQTLR